MSVIKTHMPFKIRMEGRMNGHDFVVQAVGEGKPFEGEQFVKFKVIEGAPLPFALHVLMPSFCYGNKAFIKHPDGIPDYYKLSFPAGFSWERTMEYEDGGMISVSNHSRLVDGVFNYTVRVVGVNFPPDSPVMTKQTTGWEPSYEAITPRGKDLEGIVAWPMTLKNGGHLMVNMKTAYKSCKPVQVPPYHFVAHRLVIKQEENNALTYIEKAEALHSHLPHDVSFPAPNFSF